MTGPDWADGNYSRTAEVLAPVAVRIVEHAGLEPGDRVLDVGCGTGNVALEAAIRGAVVDAVDPSEGLLNQARGRAAEAGATIGLAVAEAGELPFADETFDVVLSCFAVIFAPDPDAAARELVRVCRRDGRIAMTSWVAEGAVHQAATIVIDALPAGPEPASRPRWDDPAWVEERFRAAGAASVEIERHSHRFHAPSPAEWFADQETHHPFWRWARRLLDEPTWERVRRDSVAALAAGSDDPVSFDARGDYLLISASPGPVS